MLGIFGFGFDYFCLEDRKTTQQSEMKKLSLYIIVGLMFCNVGVAEQVEFSCKVGSFDLWGMTSEDKQRFKKKTIKFLVDTDEMKIYNNSEDDELSVIHGIENSIDIKDGINRVGTSSAEVMLKKFIEKTIKEKKINEKQLVIKTPEELLLEYKEIFSAVTRSDSLR